jgi:PEP-CTERM motif
MRKLILASALSVCFLSVGLVKAATVITFEDLAEGATLSNQYSALGVTFSPNAFTGANSNSTSQPWATNTNMIITGIDLGAGGTPVLSSGKLLHSFNGYLNENGDPSFLATFSNPINFFSADFVGVFTPGDVTLVAYNGSVIIGTSVVAAASCAPTCQTTLSFSAPSITKIAVTPGSFADWVGVDNITFTQVTAVPEPSEVAMMMSGLGVLAWMRRRRKSETLNLAR